MPQVRRKGRVEGERVGRRRDGSGEVPIPRIGREGSHRAGGG